MGFAALALSASGVAMAQSPDQQLAQEDRIAELERTVKVLAEELERTRVDVTVPEEKDLVSRYGLGPAASKIYGVARGISIGGYAEGFYQNLFHDANGGKDNTDMLRAVLYTGQTSLMSEMGSIPLQFVIEAKTLEEAFTLFPKAMEVGYAKMVEELKEMRREQASRIVVPQGPMPNLTGGAPGSAPGKIHLR
jgi:hypothetical protein